MSFLIVKSLVNLQKNTFHCHPIKSELTANFARSCKCVLICKRMQVAGESNLTQLCECLRRYIDRESFVREVLAHLYSHTSDTEEPQPHILKVQKSLLLSDLYLLTKHEQAGVLESVMSDENLL